jgi:hypothetical protein
VWDGYFLGRNIDFLDSDLIEWCTRFGLEIAIEWSLLAGTLTDLEL